MRTRRSAIRSALMVSAVLATGLGPAPLAYADDVPADEVADVTARGDRIPLDDPAAQEQVAQALITAAGLPGLTGSEKLEIEAELARLGALNPALAASTREALDSPGTQAGGADVPDLMVLETSHQAQARSYWCGPATASMIVRFKGRPHTQTTLANADFLRTEQNGATTWVSGLMATGMNKALAEPRYQQVQSPRGVTLKGATVDSVNAHYPVALDTVEFAGGRHYNGHPVDRTIGHWIVGNGYSNSGSTLHLMDPSTSYYPDAEPTFTHGAAGMAQYYLRTNGIAW